MAKKDDNILEVLSQTPWWFSVVLSAFTYVALRFIIPLIEINNPILRGLSGAAPSVAGFLAFVFILPAPFAFYNSWRKKNLLDKQSDLESIRSLSWKEFEELIAEAYRRKGYTVVENYRVGPDGGIDLVLKKSGNLCLVQCKHWRAQKVDVRIVREMYALMTAECASSAIVITSGTFTHDAKMFAENKPIDLVAGNQVTDLIRSVQKQPLPQTANIHSQPEQITCEKCGAGLVLRTARRGQTSGSKFWGCSTYPKCTFTRDYTA
jgi:restriction system protein